MKKILLFVFVTSLALVFLTTLPTPTATAELEGAWPTTAQVLYNASPRGTLLAKGADAWYRFDFRSPENFDKAEIRFDCRGLLGLETIKRLHDLQQFEGVFYDPQNIDTFLKAWRSQEKLPKPVGFLTPIRDTSGNISYWSWDDGDRTGVDLKTELGLGVWLARLRYTGNDKFLSCSLVRSGYYKNSAHP